MPRYRREPAPGHLHHVIARCVGGEFLIGRNGGRLNYLSRVAAAVRNSGWRPICYGIMDNHAHWGVVASTTPVAAFTRPLHTGFAAWLNGTSGRIGPVFTGRPTVRVRHAQDAGQLIAYIHNNPVRAGLVRATDESSWTSHQAFLGLAPAPDWLDWRLGLRLAGCDATADGRAGFAELVRSHAGDARDPTLSIVFEAERRARVRGLLGSAIEVGSPTQADDGAERVAIYAPEAAVVRDRWNGDLLALVALASAACGATPGAIRSQDRKRSLARARRLVVLTGREYLGRSLAEVASVVGISSPAAVNLMRRRPQAVEALRSTARELAAKLRGPTESE